MGADVAVVGGGIVGTMIAHEVLAREPGATVVLLEKDTVGSGATRRSAGLHFPRGATPRVRAMSARSQDRYRALLDADPRLPIHPVPMSVVSAADPGALAETYLDHLSPAATADLPADLAPVPAGARVWRCDSAQYADVYDLTRALVDRLRPRVRVREGVRVVDLDSSGPRVRLALGTGEVLDADRVVLAPGPWLAEPAWAALLAPLDLRVKKVVALHVRRTPEPGDGAVVFHDRDAFLLPFAERGHWLFSYTCGTWGVDPQDPAAGLDAHDLAEATESLRAHAPDLAGHPVSGRVFCDAYSPDREPLVRALDERGRVVVAGAAHGAGDRLAPPIPAAAADLVAAASAERSSA